MLTNIKNPVAAAIDPNPFLIDFLSPSGNAIFIAPKPLDATPELSVGELENLKITHQNTVYTYSPTEYLFSFDTTLDIPAGGKIVFQFPDHRIWKSEAAEVQVHTGSGFETTFAGFTVNWDTSGVWLNKLTLNSFCSTGCSAGSYQFKISGISNPNYVMPITGNFVASITDASGGVISKGVIPNSDVGSILPSPMTASVERTNNNLSVATGLKVSFTTTNPYPDNGKIIFKVPTNQMKLNGSSVTCKTGDLTETLTCSVQNTDSYYVSF